MIKVEDPARDIFYGFAQIVLVFKDARDKGIYLARAKTFKEYFDWAAEEFCIPFTYDRCLRLMEVADTYGVSPFFGDIIRLPFPFLEETKSNPELLKQIMQGKISDPKELERFPFLKNYPGFIEVTEENMQKWLDAQGESK